jgi:hypothetical protein
MSQILVKKLRKQSAGWKLYLKALDRIASVVRNYKNKLAAKGIISESSLEFMSQFFFVTTEKTKCWLEEVYQKARSNSCCKFC